MSKPLWDKGNDVDATMLRYTARDDWQLDQRLLPYDLAATRAHVRGLGRIDVLDDTEVAKLEAAIAQLLDRTERGEFVLSDADEDGHAAIEAALVAELGDVGKKVHTGRSRNDQVLVALRMYERDALDVLADAARSGALALVERADADANTPMPGYTHLQRAVPSSIGLWLSGIAEGLADARDTLRSARNLINRCPLGGAAGYGVNLPLDRPFVAAELGFDAVADNPLASQNSRGTHEVAVLGAAWQLMAVVRRFAWDVSLFTTSEFGFVKLDDALTTGSSIMPNKKNPDVVELMRAACGVVQGATFELMSTLSLPSGYQRDMQLTKAPLMRALDETLATISLLPRLVDGLHFDHARMSAAITPDCFATDRAVELVAKGLPFRDAYVQVAQEIDTLEQGDPSASLKARTSPGGPGALALSALRRRLKT